MNDDELLCPVCGLLQNIPPWTEGGGGSLEICPCCSIQFGYDDATRATFKGPPNQLPLYSELRAKWIAGGMEWWSCRPVPEDYNPIKQLAAIGVHLDGNEALVQKE